jgi:hypothetical protein
MELFTGRFQAYKDVKMVETDPRFVYCVRVILGEGLGGDRHLNIQGPWAGVDCLIL